MSASGLAAIVDVLERAGVPYMVAGSTASTFYAEPRTTHDIDIVVDPSRAQLAAMLQGLPDEEWYASPEAARDALARRAMFNVIHRATGWKVDLIVRKARPFSAEELRRRQRYTIGGVALWLASVEDCILAKLEWAQLAGRSERQLRDVAAMLRVQGDRVDRVYVTRWAAELGVGELWAELGEELGGHGLR